VLVFSQRQLYKSLCWLVGWSVDWSIIELFLQILLFGGKQKFYIALADVYIALLGQYSSFAILRIEHGVRLNYIWDSTGNP
jgi:hypothetical protein